MQGNGRAEAGTDYLDTAVAGESATRQDGAKLLRVALVCILFGGITPATQFRC